MGNVSRTARRFYVEIRSDCEMDAQSAVLTIRNGELQIEGERRFCLPMAQIRKVQPFMNSARIQADPLTGKTLDRESDVALTITDAAGIDRLYLIHVLKKEGISESLFEQLSQ